MFLYREGDPTGAYLIPQTSHAWLAWQVAEHWGNRDFARPAPLAETLAAILLHDCGWTEFDERPEIDDTGRPRTFDRMPVPGGLDIWRASVARSALYSRYSGLLVSSHFTALAEHRLASLLEKDDTAGARLVKSFIAAMERHQATWREKLATDARYQAYLNGHGWLVNSALMEACDTIAVSLCAAVPPPFTVTAQGASGETLEITFEAVAPGTWRVQPWPLQGDRLRVHCEGRRIAHTSFSSNQEFQETFQRAPTERLVFTLLRSSAVS